MMRQTNSILVCCALAALFLLAACGKADNVASNGAATNNANTASSSSTETSTSGIASSASVVRVEAAAVEAEAGGATEAAVKLTITNGYHVNANPPSMAYLIPTELSVEPSEGITAGKPVYPASITKKFAFSDTPLAVYEGETTIKVPLKIAAGASQGERDVKAKVRVQACDDKACYKWSMIETSIPVTVK
ncbi:MAG: protein-disulfide reductase DsbD domain-containing protein [Pyrinomonadaceae bacterium]